MNHAAAACHKGARTPQVASRAEASSPPVVSRSAPAVVPRLAAAGFAPSRAPAGPSVLLRAALAPGKPRARPSQIPAATVRNDGGDGLRSTSPVLDLVGRGGGQPLDPTTRTDMEARLGSDFSDVRIHTGDKAAKSAAAMSATAYTVGNDVVFGQGSFDPASHEGRHRLAHELVHVQQQRQGAVAGTDTGGGVAISDPADSFEQDAEAIAARVVTSAQPVDGRGLRDGHQGRPSTNTQSVAVQRKAASTPQVGPLVLGSTPGGFDPTRGDPVPGYEHPRKVYTDTDRETMRAAVNQRQRDNDAHVLGFFSTFSASITELWGMHLTEQMSRAAAARAMVDWPRLTEWFLEQAIFAVLGMGIGEIAELTAELVFEHAVENAVKRAITAKVSEVYGEESLKLGYETAKGKLEQEEIEKIRRELDNKTKSIAGIGEGLQTVLARELNIPWTDYGAWLERARPDQLAAFRLPKIFAHVDEDKIRTAAAGAIVTTLHESHTNDEPPSWIGTDPTEHDETSYFDDFQIISHLHISELGALSEESTEIYVRNSSPLLNQLKGKPIGLMGQIPLFVAIGEDRAEVDDMVAAYWVLRGVVKEAGRRYGSSVVWDESAAGLFVQLYPPRERELRITRSPKSATEGSEELSGHVAVRGGGLGEHLMLLRNWARPGGLDVENNIIGEITDKLGDVVKRDYPRQDETGSRLGDFPVRETVPIVQEILKYWLERGAEALIIKYVAGLKPDVPENRWEKDYYDKGTRKQILKR